MWEMECGKTEAEKIINTLQMVLQTPFRQIADWRRHVEIRAAPEYSSNRLLEAKLY